MEQGYGPDRGIQSYSELRMAIRDERKSAENEALVDMPIHFPGVTESLVNVAFRKLTHLAGFLFTVFGLPADRDRSSTRDFHVFGRLIETPVHQIGKGLNVRILGIDPTCILALQCFVDLFRVSRNAFKLTGLRISHQEMTNADDNCRPWRPGTRPDVR